MYKLPPDKRNRFSNLDIIVAFVPYINFIVAISYLLRVESRKRGLKMLAISLIVNGLCSAIGRLLFVSVSDVPFLTWLDRVSWNLPSNWWIWIVLALAIPSLTIRYVQSRKLARTWQALATRTRLDYKPSGCLGLSRRAHITGYYRERKLLLYTYFPLLINKILDETRLELSVANPSDLQIRLEYVPAWQVINVLLKTRNQVQVGDEAFDAAFTLYSKDPVLASRVFTSPGMRQSLFRLREYTTIELNQTHLSLEHTGRECDMDYLYFCFDTLSDLADVIERLG